MMHAEDGRQGNQGAALRPGFSGESTACEYLARLGLTIVERNFRCREGEIDVVARDGDVTVFVEVKERRGPEHGSAYEAVTPGKRRRVIHAARLYAAQHGLTERPLRFDVISIDWVNEGRPKVRHDRGAFDADGR